MNNLPDGWDEARIQDIINHYEGQSEDEAVVEGEVRALIQNIIVDSEVCHGAAILRGTRILAADVLEQLENGVPWATVVEEWRIPNYGQDSTDISTMDALALALLDIMDLISNELEVQDKERVDHAVDTLNAWRKSHGIGKT